MVVLCICLSTLIVQPKIRTAKAKLLITPDPFLADALAEYLSLVYPENRAEERLKEWRFEVLGWLDRKTRDVPDKYATIEEAYEKEYLGSVICSRRSTFICHMFRKAIGDDVFFETRQDYENLRASSSGPLSTADFQKIAEGSYGKPLDWFFQQWSKEMELASRTELPELRLESVNATKNGNGWRIHGNLIQFGESFFRLPVKLTIKTDKGIEHHTIWQNQRDTSFEIATSNRPIKLIADANGNIMRIGRMIPHLFGYWNVYPSITIIYGTTREADSNKAAAELSNNQYWGLDADRIKADRDTTDEDLKAECIILFGRPDTNKITEQLGDIFPIRFDKDSFIWQNTTYDSLDLGVVQVVDDQTEPNRLIMLCAGLSGEATMQISDSYLHDAECSYVIFDRKHLVSGEWFSREQLLLYGDWEDVNGDLVWIFGEDTESK
jgi:hypothetical protein